MKSNQYIKKIFALFLTGITLAGGLTSCSGDENKKETTFPVEEFASSFEYTGTIENNDVVITKYTADYNHVVLPSYVVGIGEEAFDDCDDLLSIVIPNSVTSIAFGAFKNCDSLKKLELPFLGESLAATENVHLGYIFGADHSSKNSYYVPKSLTELKVNQISEVPSYAFSDCSSLKNIIIPDNVTKINIGAFKNCNNLETFVIPAEITEIANYTFYGCFSLKEINIHEKITKIGKNAFNYCNSLKELYLPKSLKKIDEFAFKNCYSITGVYYYGTLEDWCKITFTKKNANPMSLANIRKFHLLDENNEWKEVIDLVIPESITKVKDFTFAGFSNVKTVWVHKGVVGFGTDAFNECALLKSVYYYSVTNDWKFYKLHEVLKTDTIDHFYIQDENGEWFDDIKKLGTNFPVLPPEGYKPPKNK